MRKTVFFCFNLEDFFLLFLGKGGASTTDDCGLVVKYDCCTKLVNIYLEWVRYGMDCTIASLSFVFGESDLLKLSWKKEENEILSTQKKLESNKRAFQVFNNALSKFDFI
jgi:hypothetical protein